MGLDMYLHGEKYLWDDNRKEDDFEIEKIFVKLGYWRKHPDLHGYIVQTFADGKDECQEIPLEAEQLRMIINAVKNKKLPPTKGFFFGSSDNGNRQIAKDVEIFEKAIKWLERGDQPPVMEQIAESGPIQVLSVEMPKAQLKDSRAVFYRASW